MSKSAASASSFDIANQMQMRNNHPDVNHTSVASSQAIGEMGGGGGEPIISGNLDESVRLGGHEGISIGTSSLDNEGLLGKTKEANFMSQTLKQTVDSLSTTLGPLQNMDKALSETQMQPYAGQNFATESLATHIKQQSALTNDTGGQQP